MPVDLDQLYDQLNAASGNRLTPREELDRRNSATRGAAEYLAQRATGIGQQAAQLGNIGVAEPETFNQDLARAFPGLSEQDVSHLRGQYDEQVRAQVNIGRVRRYADQARRSTGRGVNDTIVSAIPIVKDIAGVASNLTVRSAVMRIRAGEATEDDYRRLGESIGDSERRGDRGFGRQVVDLIAGSIGFAGDLGLTRGMLSGARALGTRALGNIGGRTAGFLGATAPAVGMLGAVRSTERMIPSTDPNTPLPSTSRAIAEGVADAAIEVGSEFAGGPLGHLASRIPGVGRVFRRLTPGRNSWLARGGFHGPLGEMLEERISDLAGGATGVRRRPDGSPDYGLIGTFARGEILEGFRDLAVEGTAFGIMGTMHGNGWRVAGRILGRNLQNGPAILTLPPLDPDADLTQPVPARQGALGTFPRADPTETIGDRYQRMVAEVNGRNQAIVQEWIETTSIDNLERWTGQFGITEGLVQQRREAEILRSEAIESARRGISQDAAQAQIRQRLNEIGVEIQRQSREVLTRFRDGLAQVQNEILGQFERPGQDAAQTTPESTPTVETGQSPSQTVQSPVATPQAQETPATTTAPTVSPGAQRARAAFSSIFPSMQVAESGLMSDKLRVVEDGKLLSEFTVSVKYDPASDMANVDFDRKLVSPRKGELKPGKTVSTGMEPGALDFMKEVTKLIQAFKEKGVGVEYVAQDAGRDVHRGERAAFYTKLLTKAGFEKVGEVQGDAQVTHQWRPIRERRAVEPEESPSRYKQLLNRQVEPKTLRERVIFSGGLNTQSIRAQFGVKSKAQRNAVGGGVSLNEVGLSGLVRDEGEPIDTLAQTLAHEGWLRSTPVEGVDADYTEELLDLLLTQPGRHRGGQVDESEIDKQRREHELLVKEIYDAAIAEGATPEEAERIARGNFRVEIQDGVRAGAESAIAENPDAADDFLSDEDIDALTEREPWDVDPVPPRPAEAAQASTPAGEPPYAASAAQVTKPPVVDWDRIDRLRRQHAGAPDSPKDVQKPLNRQTYDPAPEGTPLRILQEIGEGKPANESPERVTAHRIEAEQARRPREGDPRSTPEYEDLVDRYAEFFDPEVPGMIVPEAELIQVVEDMRTLARGTDPADAALIAAVKDVLADYADQIKALGTKKRRGRRGEQAMAGTIPPIPRTGDGANRISSYQIIRWMSHLFDVPIRVGRIIGKAAGIYKTNPEVVRLKGIFAGDLSVASHELFHHLDKMFAMIENAPLNVQEELAQMDYDQDRLEAAEGLAEWGRMWLTGAAAGLHQAAPATSQWFDNWLATNQAEHEKLRRIQAMISHWAGQNELDKVLAAVGPDTKNAPNIGFFGRIRESLSNWGHRFYADWKDSHHAFRRLGWEAQKQGVSEKEAMAPHNYAMTMGDNAANWAFEALATGYRSVVTGDNLGPGLREALDGITEKELDIDAEDGGQFIAYIVAGRAAELMKPKPRANGTVPKARVAGPFTLQEAEAVLAQFQGNTRFEAARDKIKAFRNAGVRMMVDVGAYSQQEGQAIIDSSEWATPFFRVFDTKEQGSAFSKASGARVIKIPRAFARLHGSGRQIADPISSLMTEAFKLTDQAVQYRNHNLIYQLHNKAQGLGKWVEVVPAMSMPSKLSVEEIKRQLIDAGMEEDAFDGIHKANLAKTFPAEVARIANWDDLSALEAVDAIANQLPIGARPAVHAAMGNLSETLLNIWRPNYDIARPDEKLVRIFVNGKPVLMQYHPELWRAVGGIRNELQMGVFMGVMHEFSKIQRLGATGINPSFTVPNFVADYLTYLMRRQHGGVLDPFKAIASYAKSKDSGDPAGEWYRRMGVPLTTLAGGDVDQVRRAHAQLKGQHLSKGEKIGNAIDAVREFVGFTESGPRFAEFLGALDKAGWDAARRIEAKRKGEVPPMEVLIEATLAAKDVTINFHRQGFKMVRFNAVFPWVNASAEAMDGFLRSAASNPKTFAVRAAWMASAGVIYHLMTRNLDCYKDAPAWRKYGYFLAGCEDGMQVPRRGEANWLIIAPAQAITEAILEGRPGAIGDVAMESIQANQVTAPLAILPNLLMGNDVRGILGNLPRPGGFPVLEGIMNYDTFRRREIWSERGSRVQPGDQARESTSWLMRRIGEAVNISPARLEHAVDGALGGLFGQTVKPLEAALGAREFNWRELPVLRRFSARGEFSQSLDQFREDAERSDRAYNSARLRGPIPLAIRETHDRFQDYGRLMSGIYEAAEAVPLDSRRQYQRFAIGLARHALREEPLPLYPNPLRMRDLPPSIAGLMDDFTTSQLVAASSPRPVREPRESPEHYQERMARWDTSTRLARQRIAEISPSEEEIDRLMRQWRTRRHITQETLSRRRGVLAR